MKKITLIILTLISHLVFAQNSTVTYQGYLKANGAPVNETVDFIVNYQPDGNQAGTFIQSETFNSVLVIDGLFTLPLGSTPLTIPLDEMFSIYPDIWIELLVNGVVQFPWQKIRLTPYAIDSLSLDGRLASEYALTTETASLQSQIDNINIGTTPWADGFGGTQYIGDVIIGDLAASAGDTLQILSEVDESPLRLLVGGVGTRFRVSKNGGTGIGANYNDTQIPDNGLRVAGNVQLGKTSIGGSPDLAPGNGLNVEGTVLAKSDMKVYRNLAIGPNANFAGSTSLQINSESGRSPLRIKINNSTKMRIYDNGGTSLGGNTAPETNGLVVQGNILAKSDVNVDGKVTVTGDSNVAVSTLTLDGASPLKANVNGLTKLIVAGNGGTSIGGGSGALTNLPTDGLYIAGDTKLNSDLILVGKPKQDLGSHGFAKAGLSFYCSPTPTVFNSFNNVNTNPILVLPHVIPEYANNNGLCRIQFPFNINALFIQARVDALGSGLYSRIVSCRKMPGANQVLECRVSFSGGGSVNTSVVTLLLF